MLACVAGPEEAEIALMGGADFVTFGETVPMADGVAYLRIGMRGNAEDLAVEVPRVTPIAVLFADASPDFSMLPALAEAGCFGAMLDTRAARLLDHSDILGLRGFVASCHAIGLRSGLAGSCELPDIPRLLLLHPDLLGFRDALYGANGAIDIDRIKAIRELISERSELRPAAMQDDRPTAARGEDIGLDRVLVEDLVLPVSIGAYARERTFRQRVRFCVAASVMPGKRVAQDMRDVFSYDLITDGIRLLVASDHFVFVETLAERVAEMVLDHPRVAKVLVRVEKLDLGPQRVGVEIERRR